MPVAARAPTAIRDVAACARSPFAATPWREHARRSKIKS